MKPSSRAFGVASSWGPDFASRCAVAVEDLGYHSIWTNDTPGADGGAVARAMMTVTSRLIVGIGVIACDRRTPAQIAGMVRDGLDEKRLVLGVGAGFSPRPLAAARVCVEELRASFGDTLWIALAAMGPKMSRLAGEIADVVLLNWMTPQAIEAAREHIQRGGRARVSAYVRTAVGTKARSLIRGEAERYFTLPHYRRHFEAMSADLSEVGIALDAGVDDAGSIGTEISAYESLLDETIFRALPGSEPPSIDEVISIAERVRPAPDIPDDS